MSRELIPDWTNRNTITGEVFFEMSRTRKGTTNAVPNPFADKISNPMNF